MTDQTIVLVDLTGYSDRQRFLEESLGIGAARDFDAQIAGFITAALEGGSDSAGGNVVMHTGDGALLRFATADPALDFAARLHGLAAAHNARLTEPGARRVFRVGIATGPVACDENTGALSGATISRAARMEAKADPGGVLIDPATQAAASPALVAGYRGPETVAGKRAETFTAWRCQIDPHGPAHAAAAAPTPPAARRSDAQAARRERAQKLAVIEADFRRLRIDQFDLLIYTLGIEPHRAPPATLNGEARRNAIIQWAIEENELDWLAEQLRAIVGTPPENAQQ